MWCFVGLFFDTVTHMILLNDVGSLWNKRDSVKLVFLVTFQIGNSMLNQTMLNHAIGCITGYFFRTSFVLIYIKNLLNNLILRFLPMTLTYSPKARRTLADFWSADEKSSLIG